MACFGFSGDLGNVDTLTGIGWSFEGFSKGKGGKKAIDLSGACNDDGSFNSSFKAKGKKVKGWLTVEDLPGDGMDASFNYQGKDYNFTPGERVKIKLTNKNRTQLVDHDLPLDQERPDPLTGGGVFNSRDLLIDPDRFTLLRQTELSPGTVDAIAEQTNPIGDLPGILLTPGSASTNRNW
jgi:hypothetical protein